MIYNLDLERYILAGLIQHQDIYSEITVFDLCESDFYYPINKSIFKIIRNFLENKTSFDFFNITNKISSLKISFQDCVDPKSYIESLELLRIKKENIAPSILNLKTISQKRDYVEFCDKTKKYLVNDTDMSYEEVSSYMEKELYAKFNNYYDTNDQIDLFESTFDRLIERAQNPIETVGLKTPFPVYEDRYGDLQDGQVYVYCARPKAGKTTFINNLVFKTSLLNNVPSLILDTEMQEDEIGDRMLASITSIPIWYLRTGNYGKNKEFADRVLEAREKYKKENWRMDHRYVANVPIDKIISKIKKWYYTKVGRNNKCVIAYDYIKLTGESLSEFNKEHQVIGEKVNALKTCMGKDVKAPLITSLQLNRSGDTSKGNQSDDSTAISLSDRVLWFATQINIFRRKTLEELAIEGTEFGTHKLINIESRWQGKSSFGHQDFIKNNEGKYCRYFINYNIDNFNVKELGGADDMFDKLRLKDKVKEEKVENPLTDSDNPISAKEILQEAEKEIQTEMFNN